MQAMMGRGGGTGTMGGYGAMPGMMGGGASTKKEDLKTLTRTDFVIHIVWQPPSKDDVPKTAEEKSKQIEEDLAAMQKAAAELSGSAPVNVEELSKLSFNRTEKALQAAQQELEQAEAAAEAEAGSPPVDPSATVPAPGP